MVEQPVVLPTNFFPVFDDVLSNFTKISMIIITSDVALLIQMCY